MMSSRKRPTESAWDSDDDLLQDDLPGINAFPRTKNEEDELDEDALLGLDSGDEDMGLSKPEISITENNTLGNSLAEEEEEAESDTGVDEQEVLEDSIDIGVNADEDIDELATEEDNAIDEEFNSEEQTEEVEEEQREEEDREVMEQADGVEEMVNTSQEEKNLFANREESESDSESDDEEKGRGRFKSERVTVTTKSVSKTRTDIPDTLEISEEQQHEIEQFMANKQNQRFGRRGGRGNRGQQHMGRGGYMNAGRGGQMNAGRGQMNAGRGGQMNAGRGGQMNIGHGGQMNIGQGQMNAGQGQMNAGRGDQMNVGRGGQMNMGRGGQMNVGQPFQQQMPTVFISHPEQQSMPVPQIPVHTGQQPPVHTGQQPPIHTGQQPPIHTGQQPPVKMRKIHVNPHFKGATAQVTSASWQAQVSTAVSWSGSPNIGTVQQPNNLPPPTSQIHEAWPPHSQRMVSPGQYPPPLISVATTQPYQVQAPYTSQYQQGPPRQEIRFSQHAPPAQNYPPAQPQPRPLNTVAPNQPQPPIAGSPYPTRHLVPQAPAQPSPGMRPGPRPLMQQPMYPPHSAPTGQSPFHPRPMQRSPVMPPRVINSGPRFQTPMSPPPLVLQRPPFEQHRMPHIQGSQRPPRQYEPSHMQPVQQSSQFQQRPGFQQPQRMPPPLLPPPQQHQPPLQHQVPPTHKDYPTEQFQQQEDENQNQYSDPQDQNQFGNQGLNRLENKRVYPVVKKPPNTRQIGNYRQTTNPNLKVLSSPSPPHRIVARKRPPVNETLTSPSKIARKEPQVPLDDDAERLQKLLEEQKRKREMIQRQKELRRQQQAEQRRLELVKKLADQGKSIEDIAGPIETVESNPTKAQVSKGQQIQTISRQGQGQIQAGHGRGMKPAVRSLKSTTQIQDPFNQTQVQSELKPNQTAVQRLGNKTFQTAAGRGRGLKSPMRGRGSFGQARARPVQQPVVQQNKNNSNSQNKSVQKQWQLGDQQKGVQNAQRTVLNPSQPGFNVSQQNVVKNIVLQNSGQTEDFQNVQGMNKQSMEGNASQQFSGRGQRHRGRGGMNRGMSPGINRGMSSGINRGMSPGINRGMNSGNNRGINHGMNRGMNPGLNRGMNQGMNRGMNQGMNTRMNRGMMNRGMNQGVNRGMMNTGMSRGMMTNRGGNPGMMNRGMNRGNFRGGRGRGGGNQQGFTSPEKQGNNPLGSPPPNTGQQPNLPTGVVQPEVNTSQQVSHKQKERSSRTIITSPVQKRTVVKQSPQPVKPVVSSRTVVSKQGAGRGKGQTNTARRVVNNKSGPTLVSIDNLSASTSEGDVRKLCRSFGEPESVAMISSQRKAMIKFSSPVHAAGFTHKYNRYMLDLSHITVRTLSS